MAPLARLRNVGKAALADFKLLGIASVSQLAREDADSLYARLCLMTGRRHDPCVHDVFAAAIHQAKTGEALDWWAFTPARKRRQASGDFPAPPAP
ncbi:Mitomycin resistance protein mcrB [Rhodoblastus sphagnicola]|uniref:Mitomycin resistance protein mcrB n=2 Tax=Rhodoblastus sphagnicola TaxID=333368 RepID=A0A2S6NE54_9HYPH|nr:Mitomycin resistance protein mcrB [Rhodoblastus sphagnicola]